MRPVWMVTAALSEILTLGLSSCGQHS